MSDSNKLIPVTDATFAEQVLGSQTPVLVKFEAQWCGPCKAMKPMVDEIANEYSGRLTELLSADRREDALVHFMRQVGVPDEMIAGIRQTPYWQVGLNLAHTLAYDAAIEGGAERIALVGMGCQTSSPPVMKARKVGKVGRRFAIAGDQVSTSCSSALRAWSGLSFP